MFQRRSLLEARRFEELLSQLELQQAMRQQGQGRKRKRKATGRGGAANSNGAEGNARRDRALKQAAEGAYCKAIKR